MDQIAQDSLIRFSADSAETLVLDTLQGVDTARVYQATFQLVQAVEPSVSCMDIISQVIAGLAMIGTVGSFIWLIRENREQKKKIDNLATLAEEAQNQSKELKNMVVALVSGNKMLVQSKKPEFQASLNRIGGGQGSPFKIKLKNIGLPGAIAIIRAMEILEYNKDSFRIESLDRINAPATKPGESFPDIQVFLQKDQSAKGLEFSLRVEFEGPFGTMYQQVFKFIRDGFEQSGKPPVEDVDQT